MQRYRVTAHTDIQIVASLPEPASSPRPKKAGTETIHLRRGESREDTGRINRLVETAGTVRLNEVPHPFEVGETVKMTRLASIQRVA